MMMGRARLCDRLHTPCCNNKMAMREEEHRIDCTTTRVRGCRRSGQAASFAWLERMRTKKRTVSQVDACNNSLVSKRCNIGDNSPTHYDSHSFYAYLSVSEEAHIWTSLVLDYLFIRSIYSPVKSTPLSLFAWRSP